MTSRNRWKYLFIGLVLVLALFALADSLGFFNPKPYTAVSHGSHFHYVPHDRNPDIGIHEFPQEEPGPGEVITSQGEIVRTDSLPTANGQ
ncbi:MAG: hypothetical protein U5K31_08155 [Balneolaceae bacterium]|nr:hypothetical protein [Balneolaceae bacterium]